MDKASSTVGTDDHEKDRSGILFRIFPMPRHSVMLLIVWLLLNGLSAGHVVLGSVLAILIPILTFPLVRGHPAVKSWFAVAQYFCRLIADIIVANFEVAKLVLRPNNMLNPGWIAVPVELPHPFQRTILASTISLTPGTVSVDFSADQTVLYVHVLNLENSEAMIEQIKTRYEAGIKEIFKC